MTFDEWVAKTYPHCERLERIAMHEAWNAAWSDAASVARPEERPSIPTGYKGVVWFREDGAFYFDGKDWQPFSGMNGGRDCPDCGGTGSTPVAHCLRCGGTGQLPQNGDSR